MFALRTCVLMNRLMLCQHYESLRNIGSRGSSDHSYDQVLMLDTYIQVLF